MEREYRDEVAASESRAVFDTSPVPTLVQDGETAEILDVNEACEGLFGYDASTLCGMDVWEFSPSVPDAEDRAREVVRTAVAEGEHGFDWEITRPDGSRATVHVELRRHSAGERPRVLAFVTDVTVDRKREQALTELPAVAAELMEAETTERIAAVTTDAVEDTVDFTFAAVRLLGANGLEVASTTTATDNSLAGRLPTYEVGEGFVGEAFEAGEPRVVDDVSTVSGDVDYGPIRSAVCIPLGRHGVLSLGGEAVGQFDDSDVEFARVLTRLTESALDQVDREKRLQERTEQLETLLNNAPLIFYELDTEGVIAESRGRGLRQLDLEPGEADGNNILEMYAEFPGVQRVVERALDGERVSETVRVDDQWLDNTFQPVFDDGGDLERIVGVAFNVTEQKRIEEQFAALSESAIELSESDSAEAAVDGALEVAETVLEEPVVAYWEADDEPDRLVASAVSDSAEVMNEGPLGDLVHEPGDPVYAAFEAGETVVENDFDAAATASAAPLRSLILAPVGDHGLLTVGDPEPGAFDERNRYLVALLSGILRSTLDRHRYERELVENQRELERSNESLQQFAYVASHDLQEPLRMVSSYVSLLEEEYGDSFDEEGELYMEYAVDGATRMQAMIDALLQYSRVTTQGDELTETDADAVFEETARSLELLVEERDATVDWGDLPAVIADREQLGQLFQNLVENALHYGGDEPTVAVAAEREGDRVHFTVADDGPGIEGDQHDRIFEIFKQNSSRSGSTGIGLAMCRRIVNRHGGEIWVESEPGEGATFHFTMPATAETETNA